MTAQPELLPAPAPMTADDEQDSLTLLITNALGWETQNQIETVRSRVRGLGYKGTSQALRLVLGNPAADLRQAAAAFIVADETDELAFLGVDSSAHPSLKKMIRIIGREKRYAFRDLLQAPEQVLNEARTLVAITSLCLSGEVTDGVARVTQIQSGWALNDRGLVALVQKHPDDGSRIIRLMKEYGTCDAELLEEFLVACQSA